MLIIISPAKTLDPNAKNLKTATKPRLVEYTMPLVKQLRTLPAEALEELMDISPKLAELNYQRYQNFSAEFNEKNARPALLSFKGDVYTDIEVDKYNEADFDFAQSHLRILSGLYGVLCPLDLMQDYRLEMGTKLATSRGKDLYDYWGEVITEEVNQALQASSGDKVLLNLASNEYFKAIKPKLIKGKVVTVEFKEWHKGEYKVVALLAKRARGMMTNFIIRNRIDNIDGVKDFAEGGYKLCLNESNQERLVFQRKK